MIDGQASSASPPAIFVMNADGSQPRRITTATEGSFAPCWSPDGKRILYTALTTSRGNPSLYVVDADGTNAKSLPGTSDFGLGSYSPDGKRIACVKAGPGDRSPDLFVMNADGSQATQLTRTDKIEFGPVWSADGKRIFFTTIEEGSHSLGRGAIFAVDADGQNLKQLTASDSFSILNSSGMPYMLAGIGSSRSTGSGAGSSGGGTTTPPVIITRPIDDRLPGAAWEVCETYASEVCWTWTLKSGDQWYGEVGGVQADFRITVSGKTVTVRRTDQNTPLSAVYTGTLNAQNTEITGAVTWEGDDLGRRTGTWKARLKN
jgi:dipeptidyl aminopeptidase/acylaminoacyl peptidase